MNKLREQMMLTDSLLCWKFPGFTRWIAVVVDGNGVDHPMDNVVFHWQRNVDEYVRERSAFYESQGRAIMFRARRFEGWG
jgi:hypothetical protein